MAFSKYYVNGQKGLAENWTLWFGDFFSNFIGNGFLITEDTGLNVNISSGRAYIKDTNGNMFQIISNSTENVIMNDNDVNYIYLHCDNGSNYITVETLPSNLGDDILLGTVETETGTIVLITNSYRSTPLIKSVQIFDGSKYSFVSGSTTEGEIKTITQTFKFNPLRDRISSIDNIVGTVKWTGGKPFQNCNIHVKVEYDIGEGNVTFFDSDLVYNTETNIFENWLPVSNIDPANTCNLTLTATLNGYNYWSGPELRYFNVTLTVTDLFIAIGYQ